MNNLSWLIYWADVAPKVSTFVCILSFFLFFVSLIGTAFFLVSGVAYRKLKAFDTAYQLWSKDANENKGQPPRAYEDGFNIKSSDREGAVWHLTLRCFPFLAVFFFLTWGGSLLVPSKDTFYLIAGSEAGEQALKSPEIIKVRTVVNKYLDGILKNAQTEAASQTKELKRNAT